MGNEVGHSDVYMCALSISSSANQRGIHHILACSSSFLNSFCLVYRLINEAACCAQNNVRLWRSENASVLRVCVYILGMTLSWIKSAGCDAATHSSAPAGAIHSRAEHIFRPRDAYMHITYVYICMRRSHLERARSAKCLCQYFLLARRSNTRIFFRNFPLGGNFLGTFICQRAASLFILVWMQRDSLK